jgi:hypothetical protein
MPDTHPSVTSPLISPVRFTPNLEHGEPDEAETNAEIIQTMRKISETTFRNGKRALRSVHAKSHGLLLGELKVRDHLPPELAQGMFASPASFPIVMRLSTTPGDILEDSISTPRGLAIKIIGAGGARVEGSEADVTQDFVLVNGPVFNSPDPKAFLRTLKLLEPTTDKMESMKKLTSAVARGTEAVVEAVGGKSATLTSLGGNPETHILGETFYSQTPFLYGENIAKIAVFPASPNLTSLTAQALTNNGEPNMLRNVVNDFFLTQAASWEIRAQLCTNLETMPIEDASVEWPETESPYITIGVITVQPQDSWHVEKIEAIDERLSFSPWHALAAHRPLGAVNRARKPAYQSSAHFRAENNHVTIAEPKSLDDLGLEPEALHPTN